MEEQNLKPTERHIFETFNKKNIYLRQYFSFIFLYFSFHFTVKYGLGLKLLKYGLGLELFSAQEV